MPNLKLPTLFDATITGRLAAQPESRQASGGTTYTKTRLAVDFFDGKAKHTEFLDVVAFGRTAETLSDLPKGAPVLIQGRVKITTKDGDNGKHTYVDITANALYALEWPDTQSPASDANAPSRAAQRVERIPPPPIPEDDIPF